MKSTDDESCTPVGEEDFADEMPEELALQNFTEEKKLRVEVEHEERKCTYLKFQIKNIQQECLNVENFNNHLRKLLVDSQTEINQLQEEIVNQKESINDVCCSDRQQNFSNVMDAVSRIANKYRESKSALSTEIEKCNSYYTEINQKKKDVDELFDLIISLRKNQQDVLNQVESKMMEMKNRWDAISDERIEFLKMEFEKCLALKNDLSTLKVEKKNTEEELRKCTEEQEKVEADISDLSNQYDDRNSYYQSILDNLRAENQTISDDMKKLNTIYNDKFEELRLTLNRLKSERDTLKKNNEILKSQNRVYAEEIALQRQQVEMKKRELKIKLDSMKMSETEGNVEEDAIRILQNQLKELDEKTSEMKRKLKTLVEEIAPLESEYESYRHLINDDRVAIQNSRDVLETELENSNRELVDLRSKENDLRRILRDVQAAEAQRTLELKMGVDSIDEFDRAKSEVENKFGCDADEVNRLFNSHLEDIHASAIDDYDSELLLKMYMKDLSTFKETFAAKQFEMWTSERDSHDKCIERNELNKKLVAERTNFERFQDLWRDLDRNSVPKSELPDHELFQVYKKELGMYNTLRKRREKLEQEKKLLSEKLEKCDYSKYKNRNVSQSFSDLHLSEAGEEKIRKKA